MLLKTDKIETLSTSEIEALASIGIEIKKGKPKKAKETSLESYILCIKSKCSTCGAKFTEYFDMSPEGSYLQGRKIYSPPKDKKIKTVYRQKKFCVHCRDFLLSLPKEELADRFLSLLRRPIL